MKKIWLCVIAAPFVGLILGAAGVAVFNESALPTRTTIRVTDTATITVPATTTTPPGPAQRMSAGTYQVGVDVAPGRYKTVGPGGEDSCYWARLKNDSGDFSALITNGNTEGPASLTVNKGEFVELSGNCIWERK